MHKNLPVNEGTQVWSLVQEDSTCYEASPWATTTEATLESVLLNKRSHCTEKLTHCNENPVLLKINYFKNILKKNARLKFLIFQCILIFFFKIMNAGIQNFQVLVQILNSLRFLLLMIWIGVSDLTAFIVCALLTLHFTFSFSTNEIKLPMHILLVSSKRSLISSQDLMMLFNKCGKK